MERPSPNQRPQRRNQWALWLVGGLTLGAVLLPPLIWLTRLDAAYTQERWTQQQGAWAEECGNMEAYLVEVARLQPILDAWTRQVTAVTLPAPEEAAPWGEELRDVLTRVKALAPPPAFASHHRNVLMWLTITRVAYQGLTEEQDQQGARLLVAGAATLREQDTDLLTSATEHCEAGILWHA